MTLRRARNRRDKRAPLPTERQTEQPLPPDWWQEIRRPIDADAYQREQIASATSGTEELNGRY